MVTDNNCPILDTWKHCSVRSEMSFPYQLGIIKRNVRRNTYNGAVHLALLYENVIRKVLVSI